MILLIEHLHKNICPIFMPHLDYSYYKEKYYTLTG